MLRSIGKTPVNTDAYDPPGPNKDELGVEVSVTRLMSLAGIEGLPKGKKRRTTTWLAIANGMQPLTRENEWR